MYETEYWTGRWILLLISQDDNKDSGYEYSIGRLMLHEMQKRKIERLRNAARESERALNMR